MPQWDVAVESQGSALGEMASQDHSRFRALVWFDCRNISPPRAGSIHLAVAMEGRQKLAVPPCRQRHCGELRFIRAVHWLSNAFFTFEIAGRQYGEDTRLTISAS
jgi:hypothetical protein